MKTYIVTFHRSYHIEENILREANDELDKLNDFDKEQLAEEVATQLLSEDTNTTISDIQNTYSAEVEVTGEESGNKTIEILQHEISYYYDEDQEMPEDEQDHVKEMINEGYVEGELNDNNENRGWWSIVKK